MKFLVIQTAFIGDTVLATSLLEKLHHHYPKALISILVRKGNETLFNSHPFLHEVLIWNKKQNKTSNLLKLIKTIRSRKFDTVINIQRYFSTGLMTAFAGAGNRIGFDKNPLSFLFSKKIKHVFDIAQPRHEVEKNNELIKHLTDELVMKPRLYPSAKDYELIAPYTSKKFITITPTSVWFTKQYPLTKWKVLIESLEPDMVVYLLGGPENRVECEQLAAHSSNSNVTVLAGLLTFLQSAALMEKAAMNYVNDSAPLHFASARNAPVTAIFCSTIPEFGYGPLSDRSFIIQTKEILSCKPCGIHGHKVCPHAHFKCAHTIHNSELLNTLNAD